MAFTQEQVKNIIEEEYQSFMSIEEHFYPGEYNNDFKEELMLDESDIHEECSSCEDIEFNSFEVIEPDMPPLYTSSPRKGTLPFSLASPDSSILESSFLEFQTPISPSTYVSSNFSDIASPRSPFPTSLSSTSEIDIKEIKPEDFFVVKSAKRSFFSEKSTDF